MTSQQPSAPTKIFPISESLLLANTAYVFSQQDSSGEAILVSIVVNCSPSSELNVIEMGIVEIDGILCRAFELSGMVPVTELNGEGLETKAFNFTFLPENGEKGVSIYAATSPDQGLSNLQRKRRGTISIPDSVTPAPLSTLP